MEVNNRRIDLSLREKDPAQRVVSLWTLRCKPYHFLEICAGGKQIARMQRRHHLLVSRNCPRSCIPLRRIRRLRSAHCHRSTEEKQQRHAESKERRPAMNENRFHAKDTCRTFSKILACSQPRTAPQPVALRFPARSPR